MLKKDNATKMPTLGEAIQAHSVQFISNITDMTNSTCSTDR